MNIEHRTSNIEWGMGKNEETDVTVHEFKGYRKFEPLIREFLLPTRQAYEAGGNGEGMRIERGEHMSYSPKFEDIRALHSAREVLEEQSTIINPIR